MNKFNFHVALQVRLLLATAWGGWASVGDWVLRKRGV